MHLFGFFSVLAGAYVLLHKQHVKIDIIYLQFSPRVRAAIDTVTYMVFSCISGPCFITVPSLRSELWS